jgi:hypothetical protein
MSGAPRYQSCLAVLRPWPFGPPLRGRAPHSEAGLVAAHAQTTAHSSAMQPAPNGNLASPGIIYCVK